MLRKVGSLAFWAFVALSSVLMFPVALLTWAVTAPFDRRRVVLHRLTCFWASLYTWLNPAWRVTVQGREAVDWSQTYVMVANHLSLLDILVMFRLFRHFKWVSKVENFRVPLIGWNMSLNRYIPLKRGDRESIKQMMAACEQTLGEGSSVMIFPEGTRSRDGQLQPFKTGAFDLALRMNLPVLPIVVTGTGDALPKHGFVLQGRHAIGIRVLPPVGPELVAGLTATELAERVHDQYAAELGEAGTGSPAGPATSQDP